MPRAAAVRAASSSTRRVRVYPGSTLFTVMPNGATSLASLRANPVTAARTLFERMSPSTGCFTAMDVMLMMRPQRRCFIPGSTPRTRFSTLSRLRRIAACHASGEWLSNGPAGGPPAFVTSTSTAPNRSSAVPTKPSTTSGTLTSAATATTSAPVFRSIASRVSASTASPRAHSTSRAPSAASSSATARPSPRLDAATSAVLPSSPSCIAALLRWSSAAQVVVRAAQPVLAGRAEHVHVQRVLERERLVRHVGRDVQDLARAHVHLLRLVLADPEAQRAFEDVRDLLVLVRVPRHDAPLLQVDVRDHQPVAGDQAPLELVRHLLARHRLPAEVPHPRFGLHVSTPRDLKFSRCRP